jgi:hypothetical protein
MHSRKFWAVPNPDIEAPNSLKAIRYLLSNPQPGPAFSDLLVKHAATRMALFARRQAKMALGDPSK